MYVPSGPQAKDMIHRLHTTLWDPQQSRRMKTKRSIFDGQVEHGGNLQRPENVSATVGGERGPPRLGTPSSGADSQAGDDGIAALPASHAHEVAAGGALVTKADPEVMP